MKEPRPRNRFTRLKLAYFRLTSANASRHNVIQFATPNLVISFVPGQELSQVIHPVRGFKGTLALSLPPMDGE